MKCYAATLVLTTTRLNCHTSQLPDFAFHVQNILQEIRDIQFTVTDGKANSNDAYGTTDCFIVTATHQSIMALNTAMTILAKKLKQLGLFRITTARLSFTDIDVVDIDFTMHD